MTRSLISSDATVVAGTADAAAAAAASEADADAEGVVFSFLAILDIGTGWRLPIGRKRLALSLGWPRASARGVIRIDIARGDRARPGTDANDPSSRTMSRMLALLGRWRPVRCAARRASIFAMITGFNM
jgi:hypothetical protein